MLGYDCIGQLAIGQFTLKNTYLLPSITINGTGNLTGVISSSYKDILSEPIRRLIYTAEISPWTVA